MLFYAVGFKKSHVALCLRLNSATPASILTERIRHSRPLGTNPEGSGE